MKGIGKIDYVERSMPKPKDLQVLGDILPAQTPLGSRTFEGFIRKK